MSMHNIVRRWLFLGIFFALSTQYSISSQAASDSQPITPSMQHDRDSLIIARVSTDPKEHFKRLKPTIDYLATNLQEFGIKTGKVLFAKDNQQMIRYIKQGKVDLITETAFSATIFNEKAGADIVLRRWKKGVSEYSSVIFSRKDSGVDSFEDLLGKTIAFQDRGSSSAFFIPASILIRDGYELYELDSPRELPPKDKIGFVFANKEINISVWVHKGIVAAGAFSNLDWNSEEDMPVDFKENLSVIYKSQSFPRGVVLVRSDLNSALKARINALLMTAHETEVGQQALKAYQNTKKYDELAETAESMKLAKKLQKIVEEQL